MSCAIISGPVCVNAALNSPPMSEMFGRLRWETVITISVAAQVLSLALWMGILFGLMFDERPLGKVEESMLPLTLVLLVLWFIMDVLVSACCWMSDIGL